MVFGTKVCSADFTNMNSTADIIPVPGVNAQEGKHF